jgi:hypothetical protein
MCNAYKHPSGCSCGFGPPYERVEVKIVKLPSPNNIRTRVAAEVSIKFPAARAIGVEHISRQDVGRAKAALKKFIQKKADQRFGKGKIRINVARVITGSIEFDIVLITGTGVAVYHFFKDYEQLRKSMVVFCRDIQHAARSLTRAIRKAIIFEEDKINKAQKITLKKKRR